MSDTPLHRAPIPFITLPNWVKAAAQCGFNIEPVFRELGIQTDLIHLESATVSLGMLEAAMEACVARSRSAHFPFVLGETFAFDYLPDLQTFLTTAPTLREAARVFGWVRELINPMIDVRVDEAGDEAALVVLDPPGNLPQRPYFTEALFASVVKFSRSLLRGRGEPRRLSFGHARPGYADEYARHFGLPVAFGAGRNAIEFERSLLDLPLEGGYPALHQQAEIRVERRLQHLARPTALVAAVEELLAAQPGLLRGGIGAVAAHLGLGARTLQRRLRDESQSFADVLGRVRYRLAVSYLEQPQADLEAVSEKLGFSDRRSFTRAFTRWSGVSPSAFRKRAAT
ncbi:MAG TPA: AraC family transcriptional regulator ligand-binding domain-containing protein [Candidatus Binatia bacterium]|nr:AraC family transcriptional regulator ligand-binding domain-containing protein [Candidatus Binatia bacterium]